MNIPTSARRTLGICVAIAGLAGCSGGSPPSVLGTTNSSAQTVAGGLAGRSTLLAVRTGAINPDHGASWISPEVKGKPVLFVSDSSTDDVYLYKLPTLKHVGTLTGFSQPQGECSDTKGNVWIANTGTQQVFEYSHEGVKENILTDSVGYPVGCAWDSTTGNLAVTNLYDISSSPGSVLVYSHASGSPIAYTNPSQILYYFDGYDTKGNLFFDGATSSSFVLSELPKGAATAHTVQIIGGTIYEPGTVDWYASGNYLIVGDQECGDQGHSCLYRLSIVHKAGTIQGKIKLDGYTGKTTCDVVEGTEWNNKFYGSEDGSCGSIASTTYIWPFPAGKNPSAYNNTLDSEAIGAAVSK